jgi:hypothetical protein
MQIHELTQRLQVEEGILDTAKAAAGKLGAGIQGAKQGFQQSGINRNVAATGDRAYKVWSSYKTQLQQSAAEQGRTLSAPEVEKALLAFVSKNLLGGQYLANLTNKDDIINLVKKISGTVTTSSTGGTTTKTDTGLTHQANPNNPNQPPPKPAPGAAGAFGATAGKLGGQPAVQPPGQPATKPAVQAPAKKTTLGTYGAPGTPQPITTPTGQIISKPGDPSYAELAKKAQAATAKQSVQEAVPTVKPGQLAARSAQRNAPVTPATNTMANAPVSKVNVANPTNPNQQSAAPASAPAKAAPVASKPNANEKQLFTQLVRAAALASPSVSAGQETPAQKKNQNTTNDAAGMVDQVRNTEQQQAQLAPTQLAKAGAVLRQTFQIDSSVESTGDQAVDALLLAMGFKPQ